MIGKLNQPSTYLILDGDGTLKTGSVDVAAVLADNVVESSKIADNVIGATYNPGTDLTLEAVSDVIASLGGASAPTAFPDNLRPDVDWGGRSRWYNASPTNAILVVDDPDNIYEGNTFRHINGSSIYCGMKIWIDELGVVVGDLLKLAASINSAAGTFSFSAQYCTDNLVPLSTIATSGTLTGDGTAKQIELSMPAVPTTAAYILVYTRRLSGTSNIDWYGLWLGRGSSQLYPPPIAPTFWVYDRLFDTIGWDYNLTTVTVGSSGSDYTTIAAALAAITPTRFDRYRILLAEETFTENNISMKDWIVLEGRSRTNSIVDGTLGSNDYTKDTFKATATCVFRNLTIKAHNVKYCIHADANVGAYRLLVENCHLWHDTFYPMGMGCYADQHVELRNCVFEYAGSSPESYDTGVFFHNWHEQSAACSLVMDGCQSRNCGIVTLSELGSEQMDRVRVIDCTTNCVDRGIVHVVVKNYWDGGSHTESEIPYSLQLLTQGGNCPYFKITAAHRPLLDWCITAWQARVKNVNVATLAQGTAVAYKYSSLGAKMDVDVASATRCDGVLLADVTAAAEGWMVTRGNAAQILCDTSAVSIGDWLKPNASTGQWEAATEAAALAVALGTKGAGSTGLVKARLL